jgi:hypothetical protein
MYREQFPEAMQCLATGLEECLPALRFPETHQRWIRTTNLLERLFGEGQRRSKVILRGRIIPLGFIAFVRRKICQKHGLTTSQPASSSGLRFVSQPLDLGSWRPVFRRSSGLTGIWREVWKRAVFFGESVPGRSGLHPELQRTAISIRPSTVQEG